VVCFDPRERSRLQVFAASERIQRNPTPERPLRQGAVSNLLGKMLDGCRPERGKFVGPGDHVRLPLDISKSERSGREPETEVLNLHFEFRAQS